MATYTKETALYDTGAIQSGVDDAATKATNYLAADSSGIMVYDGSNGAQTPSNPSSTTNNVFIDDDSLDIRKGTTVLATFGASGSTIGETDGTQSYLAMDYHSMQMIDKEGSAYFHISDLRDANGEATLTEHFVGDGFTTSFGVNYVITSITSVLVDSVTVPDTDYSYYANDVTFTTAPANGSDIEIVYKTTSTEAKAGTFGFRDPTGSIGGLSFAEGSNIVASGLYSHAEGKNTIASGIASHAEGKNTIASGIASHAEGDRAIASAPYSHAEGNGSSSAEYAHAEGIDSYAMGVASHAEGMSSALANCSHAQNRTVAQYDYQTTIGKYNKYVDVALIIGNGTLNSPSNAFTVDWQGNVEASGGVTVNNHSSPIGTVKYASLTSNKSVPNNTGTMLTSISLEAGVWVVACGVRWATNNSGWRRMNLSTTSGATDVQCVVHPVQSEYTQAIFTRILEVESTTTYYLNASQNSGSAINALGSSGTNYGTYITAVRIA